MVNSLILLSFVAFPLKILNLINIFMFASHFCLLQKHFLFAQIILLIWFRNIWWSYYLVVIQLCSLTQDKLIMRIYYGFMLFVFLCSICPWSVSWLCFSWVVLFREWGMSWGILPYWNPLYQHTFAGTV